MRVFIILVALLLFSGESAFGDIVHLKNGRQIKALEVWEDGDQIRCRMSNSMEIAFPKDSVERIEKEHNSSKSPAPFKYDIWESGIDIEQVIYLAERHNIPIRARGHLGGTNFNQEVKKEAKNEHVLAYKIKQLDHPARVILKFTPKSRLLYQVQVAFTVSNPRNSPFYSDLMDILSERYGKASKTYHPLNDLHTWTDENNIISLKSGWGPLTVDYLDVALDKMNTIEMEELRNEEKKKNVQAGKGVF
jgi:hypothetical protein